VKSLVVKAMSQPTRFPSSWKISKSVPDGIIPVRKSAWPSGNEKGDLKAEPYVEPSHAFPGPS
jgi:hypothetical protein